MSDVVASCGRLRSRRRPQAKMAATHLRPSFGRQASRTRSSAAGGTFASVKAAADRSLVCMGTLLGETPAFAQGAAAGKPATTFAWRPARCPAGLVLFVLLSLSPREFESAVGSGTDGLLTGRPLFTRQPESSGRCSRQADENVQVDYSTG